MDCASKTPSIIFNIFMDVRYHLVKLAGDEAALWSSTIGFKKIIKKSNVLSIEKEHNMLGQEMCLPTSHLDST
jgi:hypothetical protein